MKSPRNILLVMLAVSAVVAASLAYSFNLIAGRNRELVQQELQKFLGN